MILKISLVAIVVLFAVLIISFLRIKSLKKKVSDFSEMYEAQKNYSKRLEGRVSLLETELKVKSENRRDADEKIDALHSGDATNNALDELRKQ